MKHITITLLILLTTFECFSQITVTGKVLSSDDHGGLPGVSVIEVGTTNGTVTQQDGSFSVTVSNSESSLQFQFVGFVARQEGLKGRTHLVINLKPDCIRDWFDVQHISIYATSGLIHNPVGGRFEISFPNYFGDGTLTSSITYQTNFNESKFINGDVRLKHFAFDCNYDMNANWYYRNARLEHDFRAIGNSAELDLNLNKVGFIAGFSHLSLTPTEVERTKFYNGPVVGLRTWVYGPLRLVVSAKAALYRNKQEYFGEAIRTSKYVDVFIRYYQVDRFSELSVGAGTTFSYRKKRRR